MPGLQAWEGMTVTEVAALSLRCCKNNMKTNLPLFMYVLWADLRIPILPKRGLFS